VFCAATWKSGQFAMNEMIPTYCIPFVDELGVWCRQKYPEGKQAKKSGNVDVK
jgi:hypothetical protein